LPILLQMPIYIALYSMLNNSVELYRSPFVGWIRDLTAADPYFVLPVLTGILMFVQQRTQPVPPDPQQKMMMYLTPVMFTAFSIFLPAGFDDLYFDQYGAHLLAAVAPESRRQARATEGRDHQAGEGMMEDAANVLKTILSKMGVDHEVVASETDERITLEVTGPETGLVIGKKGQTLDSLQYMVNKIVSKKLGEGEGKPITVDAEGYRSRRAEALVEAGAQAGGEGQAHRAAGGGPIR